MGSFRVAFGDVKNYYWRPADYCWDAGAYLVKVSKKYRLVYSLNIFIAAWLLQEEQSVKENFRFY